MFELRKKMESPSNIISQLQRVIKITSVYSLNQLKIPFGMKELTPPDLSILLQANRISNYFHFLPLYEKDRYCIWFKRTKREDESIMLLINLNTLEVFIENMPTTRQLTKNEGTILIGDMINNNFWIETLILNNGNDMTRLSEIDNRRKVISILNQNPKLTERCYAKPILPLRDENIEFLKKNISKDISIVIRADRNYRMSLCYRLPAPSEMEGREWKEWIERAKELTECKEDITEHIERRLLKRKQEVVSVSVSEEEEKPKHARREGLIFKDEKEEIYKLRDEKEGIEGNASIRDIKSLRELNHREDKKRIRVIYNTHMISKGFYEVEEILD